MDSIYSKSIVFGFILGTILFAIAPLGLGISLVELLKPVLAPGAIITQQILGSSAGVSAIALALTINGAIFSLLFICYFLVRKNAN